MKSSNFEKPFPPGSLIAGYFRDSGGAEQDLSVQQQQAVFRLWCTENGYAPGRIFADIAKSGGSTAGRDQLDALMRHFENSPAEAGVVFWDYSRFARNFNDGQFFLASLRRRGYQVYSLEEAIPPGSVGKIVEALHLWRAEEYRVELARNVKRGLLHLVVELRCWPGGVPPVGFATREIDLGTRRDGSTHAGRRLVPDPNKAQLLKRAFELRATGATLPEILSQIPNLVGSVPSLGRLLRNQLYTGVFRYGNHTIENFCEPLIPADLWQAAQRINNDRKARHGYDHPRQVRSRFYLTGLVKCARCGLPLHGRVSKTKHYRTYDYYRCQSQTIYPSCGAALIPKEELETRVIERVRQLAGRPQFFEDLLAASLDVSGRKGRDLQEQLDARRTQLADASAAIDRLTLAIAEAGHSPALLARLKDLEARQAELKNEISELERELQASRPEVTRQALAERLERLAKLVDQADPRFRSQALRSLVKEIRAEKSAGQLAGAVVFYSFFDDGEFTVSL